MNKVDSPSGKSQLPTVFQLATVRKIFKALSNEDFQFQLLVLLAVTTGCREGELLGLSWDDYSSTDGTFWIHQTVQYLPQKGTYINLYPKTRHSCRRVLIVPQLRPLLEEQRGEYEALKSQAGKRWNAAHLVFLIPMELLLDRTPFQTILQILLEKMVSNICGFTTYAGSLPRG